MGIMLLVFTKIEKKTARVHKLVANAFITNTENKKCVDHIDHNPKNNHITNLRFATHSENIMNKSKHSNNTSGYIGVSFDKHAKKWLAQYNLNGKRKCIGRYNTAEEASTAYQAKIKDHYKEYANITEAK